MSKVLNKSELKKIFYVVVGAFLFSLGINMFTVPIGLYSGGFVGMGQIVRTVLVEYLHINLGSFDIAGTIYFLLNVPLFILAFRSLGKHFFAKTLLAVGASTVFMSIIPSPAVPYIADPLAACFIGGLISGAGCGMILVQGASGGGQDILGIYFMKKRGDFSVGKMTLIVNGFVYGICFILFDVTTVIYSVIFTMIQSMVIDKVHSQNICMEVMIFTANEKAEEIRAYIKDDLGRGNSYWGATGGYTETDNTIIYTIIDKHELSTLKRNVHEINPNAFVVIKEGVGVDGFFVKKLQ